MSSFLFYGPGAQQEALRLGAEGRKLGGPFGEDGLKVDDSREVVALMDSFTQMQDWFF